jgi:hypothetical protein
MLKSLSLFFFGLFLCLPFLVLLVRAARPRRMPWWATLAIPIIVGWVLVLGAAMAGETPEGGAAKVFALFFGWAYALAWFLPWLIVYGVIQLCCRRCSRRRVKQGDAAPTRTVSP